jgi:hypothetical protein
MLPFLKWGHVMRAILSVLGAAILYCAIGSSSVLAQERSAVRQGFVLPPQSGKTILVLRPSVRVAEQSTGGLPEPRAEWTAPISMRRWSNCSASSATR